MLRSTSGGISGQIRPVLGHWLGRVPGQAYFPLVGAASKMPAPRAQAEPQSAHPARDIRSAGPEGPQMLGFTDGHILNSGENNVKLPTSYFAWERTLEKELSLCSVPDLGGGYVVCSLSGNASGWTRVSMTLLRV